MAILVRLQSTLLLAAAILVLGLLYAPTTSARLCKTFFITFSIDPVRVHHHHPNPNSFIFIDTQTSADGRSITILSDEFTRSDFSSNDGLFIIDRPDLRAFSELDPPREKATSFRGLLGLEGIDFDSMMDRSKDVLSVVVALLFGVGCGALTAATMYFAWMLVVGRREDYDEEGEKGFYSDYDEIPSPRKGEYVKIHEAAAPAQAKDIV